MIDICEQEQKIFCKNNFHCSHDCLCLLTTERKKLSTLKNLRFWQSEDFSGVSISNECFIASEQSCNTKPHAVLWAQLRFSVNYSDELCTAVLTQERDNLGSEAERQQCPRPGLTVLLRDPDISCLSQ